MSLSRSDHKESLSAPLLNEHDIINNKNNMRLSCREWIYYKILSTKWYQIYILITILANLCIIAIDSMVGDSYNIIHYIFLSLFSIEVIIKIIGFGIIDRITIDQIPFFRHPYHIFDFLIVIISWITLLKFNITCTALRIVFIIFFIPILEMAMMTISILKSLFSILNVLFFFLLFYIIFGLFGVYFMKGILHNRCYEPSFNTSYYHNLTELQSTSYILCYDDNDCINSPKSNGTYTQCLPLSINPHNNIFSFDNIFFSSLQIFISSTGHWAILMSYVDECFKNWSITIYFFIMTFIYFFILLPLLLAFISDNFNDINLAKNALYLRIKKNTIFSCSTANVIFYKFSTADEDKLYYAQLISSSPRINPLLNNKQNKKLLNNNNNNNNKRKKKKKRKKRQKHKNGNSDNEDDLRSTRSSIGIELQNLGKDCKTEEEEEEEEEIEESQSIDIYESGDIYSSLSSKHYIEYERAFSSSEMTEISGITGFTDSKIRDQRLVAIALRKSQNTLLINKNEFETIDNKFRRKLYSFVNVKHQILFETIVMILITANIICLSIKNPSFSDLTNERLGLINDIFLWLYLIEMIIRITSIGFCTYWKKSSIFSIFDSILIIFVFIMYIIYISDSNSDNNTGAEDKYINGLGGTISFRLLRIIPYIRLIAPKLSSSSLCKNKNNIDGDGKYIKLFEHFNRIIIIIMDAFSQMIWLFLILILFLFICGYFGTSLYNNNDKNNAKINYDENDSFNNIIFSILTTFQIATGQDWVDVLSNTILLFNGSMWSLLYFIIIVLFGIFIFPNYFIASCIGSIDKHQNEDSEILQSVLPTAERLRKNELLKHEISEDDLKILILNEIKKKRQTLIENRIYNYLFMHRDKTVMFGRSLRCLLPNNYYRKKIHKIVTNKWYIRFIDICIIINAIIFGIFNMNDLAATAANSKQINQTEEEYWSLYIIDLLFVIIFSIEIIFNIITFGLLSKSSSLTRNWSKLVDDIHKQNWRIRCLQVWKLMCKYDDYYNVNANIYSDDLGIYEIIKSHNGLVIVWCVIPSSGLEIRILFQEDKWRTIYCCKQYYQSQIITQQIKIKDNNNNNNNNITREESASLSRSMSTRTEEQKYDDNDNDNDNDSDFDGESVPITRAGYGYNIGKKKYKFNNKKNLFRKGILSNDDIRKWEKWSLKKGILDSLDQDNKASFMLDESVEQLLLSVSLNYKNTNSFVSDSWNILDAIVVFFSLLSLMFNLKFWSTLRALRLFRVIIRQNKMRQIFTAIRKCLPSLLSLLSFMILLYFILSIIGLNLFYSTFDKCSCNDVLASNILLTKTECEGKNLYQGTIWDDITGDCKCDFSIVYKLKESICEKNPALTYSSPYFRFDDIFSALFSVFLISRGAQWDYFLYESYSNVGLNSDKISVDLHDTETIVSSGTYFLCVVFIGQYCLLSLFMAIIISNYIRYYNEESKLLLNYKQQKSLQRITIFIKTFRTKYCKISPFINHDDTKSDFIFIIKKLCLKLVDSTIFHYIIYSMIILNILISCINHYNYLQEENNNDQEFYNLLINISSIIFTLFYTIEILLKLIAYGFKHYWSYKSYRYCCIITFISWICILFKYIFNMQLIIPITCLMLFRMVVIIPYLESFWQILKWSQTNLFYIFIVTFMVLFIYSIFGKYIFGDNGINDLDDVYYISSLSYPTTTTKFGDYVSSLSYPTNLFKNISNSMYFLYIYLFNSGDAWTPALIKLLQIFKYDSIVIIFFIVIYIVIMVFYSIFYAVLIDIYSDWKKVQYISNHLRILQILQSRWKFEVFRLRDLCIDSQNKYRQDLKNQIRNRQFRKTLTMQNNSINYQNLTNNMKNYSNYMQSSIWKDCIVGTNLFDTFIPATKFLHILSILPSPIGFQTIINDNNLQTSFIPSNLTEKENRKLPADVYRKLMLYFTDLKIPIRRNNQQQIENQERKKRTQSASSKKRNKRTTTAMTITVETRTDHGFHFDEEHEQEQDDDIIMLDINNNNDNIDTRTSTMSLMSASPFTTITTTPSPAITPLSINNDNINRLSLNGGYRNNGKKTTGFRGHFDEWDFIVNFSDIMHAFTWKLLKVDVLVNVEEDEQFILDWFISNWDSVDINKFNKNNIHNDHDDEDITDIDTDQP